MQIVIPGALDPAQNPQCTLQLVRRLVGGSARIMPGEAFGCAAHFFSREARLDQVRGWEGRGCGPSGHGVWEACRGFQHPVPKA